MKKLSLLFAFVLSLCLLQAQDTDPWTSSNFNNMSFRSIGPAFMSGRIADIAIHPHDDNVWYVAVGSGGVWKTHNAGVTWTPIFDNESVYSTGCITIDPNNPSTIWLGTGENVGGRHLSWGDGVYRSTDAGKTWTNMGLPKSEHISEIIIHPDNSNVIWVASQGPLWSKGGERGVYKSTDGGQTWTQTLGDDAWTGATDLAIDPRNPDRLYCATWDRHRTVAAYMGGGPGTGLHKSEDGGETWTELKSGLPSSNMGKIGLAISPQQPDVLYAAIELDRRKGAVYRSADRGATWTKMSDAVSGATGPHYYQELYACPHVFDRLYLMDVRIQISDDGGKNFRRMTEEHKHSDNHAIAFRADDPDYLLIGTDGGMYESFDLAANWRYMGNLPITQFYKLAIDDAEPFYNVYGGTQDNSTEGGPSRTDNWHGIQNSDWRVVLNWDGHQPATEPGNPDIMYGQRQQGTLSRIDLKTGEVTDVQPQAARGEVPERFNWDAPILVSPHDPKQIFFASQRLWRSDDRGDNWRALSPDLSRNENRLELPIMGQIQSYDNAWDIYAMSNYNTITSIAESPVQRDLIYIGTDDGLFHMTADGGANWTKKEVSTISGVPRRAYVNDIKADLHDANTLYMALDNHKEGDYKPYLYMSDNQGKSWRSITDGLGETNIVWRIVQDHVNANLLFAGTEFGIYFSPNRGAKWIKLSGGLPTISFRDLAIQKRENDLVAASFGRSFYILDDYTALREMAAEDFEASAKMYSVRDAWWYIPRSHLGFETQKGSQGAQHYVAKNPDFGALFTYYIGEENKSPKDIRKEAETKATKDKQPLTFPGYDALADEASYEGPSYWLVIKDADGNIIRRIKAASSKGLHRTSWDLRESAPTSSPWPGGMLSPPGDYTVSLSRYADGEETILSGDQSFTVKPLRSGSIEGPSASERQAFWDSYTATVKKDRMVGTKLGSAQRLLSQVESAMANTPSLTPSMLRDFDKCKKDLKSIEHFIYGNPARAEHGEKAETPIIGDRMFAIYRVLSHSNYGPTGMAKQNLEIANADLDDMDGQINSTTHLLEKVAKLIFDNGGPWIEY